MASSPASSRRVLKGENEGTLFVGKSTSLSEKRRWIAFASSVSGRIHINEGAMDAITKKNASLLYAGVTRIENEFEHGDVVSIVGPERTGDRARHCELLQRRCFKADWKTFR